MASDQNDEQWTDGRAEESEKTDVDAAKDRMKKKMSKVQSRNKKSRIMHDKRSTSVTDNIVEIEPAAAVSVDDLKESYYRALRWSLVPPPSPDAGPAPRGTVNGKLAEIRDGIDEMDRALDGVDLSVFECGHPSDVLAGCAQLPLRGRQPKPETGIEMKTYRHRRKK